MALKLRPTGLGSGIDKDRPDYTVVTGEWEVGRVYETRGGPDNLRWFWSMTVNGPMTRSDRVAILEEAKAQFRRVGNLEGVGELGRGALTSLSPLAAFANRCRFFVNLLRGVTPFWRGRDWCWRNICERNAGLGNDLFGGLGYACAQSQEAKRCRALRLKS